jgi:SPP1 family predicted phage head-tail adaptor
MNYRAGDLDQRLVFEARRLDQDDMGGYRELNQPSYICWGHVRRTSAKEALKHQAIGLLITCVFVIRNTPRIHEYNTVKHNGLRYNIVGKPTLNPRDEFVELDAELIDE